MIPYTLIDFDSRNRRGSWNECCKRYHIKGVVCTMQVGLIPTVLLVKSFQKPTYVVDYSLIEKFWIKQIYTAYILHIDAYWCILPFKFVFWHSWFSVDMFSQDRFCTGHNFGANLRPQRTFLPSERIDTPWMRGETQKQWQTRLQQCCNTKHKCQYAADVAITQTISARSLFHSLRSTMNENAGMAGILGVKI